jgi:membrane protein YqaA with SNARE-associated domain
MDRKLGILVLGIAGLLALIVVIARVDLFKLAESLSYPGVFLVSLIGAVSIVYPIPYTLVIVFMGANPLFNPLFVAISAGLGSAIGELFGYTLGYYGRAMISEERQRKMDYMLKVFNRYGPAAIFIFALTPLPDDLLFIPLGILRYKLLKIFIPCLLGKISMSLILAYGGQIFTNIVETLFGGNGWLTTIITSALLILIMIAMLKIDWEKIFEKHVAKEKGTNKK